MNIQRIPANSNAYGRTRSKESIKFIVIHYTSGNGDTAVNEGLYFKNGNKSSAGAHFFVDQKGEIVKSVDINRIAWSVGGSKYPSCSTTGGGKFHGIVTNDNSVSIELCDNATKDPSPAQIESVKRLIKHIRKGCPNAKTVVRHFDVIGKLCPLRMVDDKKWKKFRKEIGE